MSSSPDSDSNPAPAARASAVLSLDDALARCAEWRAEGLRIVLTNGCFDLLHVGHLRYLQAARALGDRLIIALNDDASTHGLKGAGRPILPLEERAELLGALRCVDAIVAFGGPSAVEIVAAIAPEIYVKGGDYDFEGRRPPEADVAEAAGGLVRFLPFVAGRSTSAILRRIRGGDRQA